MYSSAIVKIHTYIFCSIVLYVAPPDLLLISTGEYFGLMWLHKNSQSFVILNLTNYS